MSSKDAAPAANPAVAGALGKVPSGLFIVTVLGPAGETTGMLASWVMQAGFEPPAVTVAVKQGRYVADWLTAGRPFNVCLLGEGHKSMLKHFGRGFEPGQPAFDGLAISHCPRGVPILSTSLGHLQCQPTAHLDSGDHRLFLAHIVGGDLAGDGPPIVHIRKNGLNY